jgi:hypothetical protein
LPQPSPLPQLSPLRHRTPPEEAPQQNSQRQLTLPPPMLMSTTQPSSCRPLLGPQAQGFVG